MTHEQDKNTISKQDPSSELKESLHLKFVRYLDLFCILWLISRGKLRIYNTNSHSSLLRALNRVKGCCNNDFGTYEDGSLHHNISLLEWKPIFRRFIHNIQIKFELEPRPDLKRDRLSPDDYRECALVLGRNPVGLCSILKRCTCKFQSEKNEFNRRDTALSYPNDYDIELCGSCILSRDSIHGPVALVSPFITSNTSNKRANKKLKISHNKIVDGSFEDNRSMYSGSQYPLHHFLSKSDETSYSPNISTCDPCMIGDTIFKLVDLILGGDISSMGVDKYTYLFVRVLEERMGRLNKTCECDTSPSELHIFQTLLVDHKELFKNTAQLTPFPTLYWLVDKHLNNAVSSLEGSGTINKLQSVIDNAISQYNSNGDLGSKTMIQRIIRDNLFYISRRLQLVHPLLIELFYNIFFNLNIFSKNGDLLEPVDAKMYITLSSDVYTDLLYRTEQEITRVLGILNTLRVYGIGGNKNFFRIKCLHNNLSFELAEGSYIGGLVAIELL